MRNRVVLLSALLVLAPLSWKMFARASGNKSQINDAQSVAAFKQVATVLTSPRCLNCHVPDNIPRQGDDNHLHTMNVKRGADGRGTPAMRCGNCHQDQNSPQMHSPPGAPGWRLPAPSEPLAWMGLSVGEICRSVRDSKTNGGKSLSQLIEHVENDRFVHWAWDPGPGRTKPLLTHEQFAQVWKTWIATGASCPAK
jgi:hypothetical protein